VIVSLNPDPSRAPDPASVIGQYDYSHPVFDLAAIGRSSACRQHPGPVHVWYCGAWTRYGFHEDGLMSAQAVVQGLRERSLFDERAAA
jgi:predicted NAD/FAD-binding protein